MYVARAGQYWLWETAQCSEGWAVLVVGHPPMYVARAGQYWLWETAQCSECWAVLVVGHPPPPSLAKGITDRNISR